MSKKKTTWAFLILAVLPSLLALTACNPLEDDSKSSTFIVIESLEGKDEAGNTASFLASDVISSAGVIYADTAAATVRANFLDPSPVIKPSGYSDIILDRYVVSYFRNDGKNQEGVDVPYTFEGALTQIIKVGSTATFSFVIVREAAKMEPPLLALAKGPIGEAIIEMTAKVDLYGHDLTNNNVTATGYMSIRFANFAN